MKTFGSRSFVALLSAVLFLMLVPGAFAITAPAVSIVDSAGNTITIDGNAVVTYGGNCTPATCITTSVTASGGFTDWVGTIGAFTMRALIGTTKPYSSPNPSLDLNLQGVHTTTGGTITVQWTDTDFNYSDIGGATIAVGGVLTGSGSSTYTAYFDNTNAPFGTGVPIGTVGPFTSGAFNGSITGPGPTASPFSMTEAMTLTLGPNATFGVDYQLIPLPAPLKLICSSNTAQTGVPYSSSLMATGGIPPYTYSIATGSLPPGLTLDSNTGKITGTPTTAGTYSFTAQVQDNSQAANDTVTSTCSIVVTNPPPISLSCPLTTGQVGVPYSSALAANGGIPPYTYSIQSGTLPNGLTLNSTTGAITGIPTQPGPFLFIAQVQDSTNTLAGTATSNCGITISTLPSATCVAINAVQNVAITPVTLTATGGSGSGYTFSATGLPAGLTISTSGTISGTPTVSGTFNYTLTIMDSAGNKGTLNCSLTVYPPVSATCVVINAVQNVPITPVTMTATGGTGTGYTFSATGLPTGLTMSTAGTISGTPTVSGTFNYTVTVTDSAGNQGTFNCSVTVAPPVSATCVVINAVQNVPITPVTMTATGGTGTGYTFSASGLPTGLTMSTAGTISGTPTVSGTFNYTVTVTDSAGNKGTFNCSVTVYPPVSATCVVINAVQNVPITPVTMTATGGSGTGYTFSATGLPTGLTMSSGGTISGTPTVSGTFNYTVTVTDSAGNKGTFNCSVTVAPPISATCVVINAIQNIAITPVTMTATGGTGTGYTFSATGLPTGLTMSAAGTISGTPTVSGTFNYTVTVTDSAGNKGTFNCSVTVYPPVSATCVVINAVQNVPITPVTMTATGGTGTGYTFSATGLPTGLTMSANGTISGTPTVSGTFNYTVTVTDSAGNQGTFNCSVTVYPPVSATCVVINAVQNVPITPVTMTATGGSGTGYTFSATGLPTGLTMSANGTISGTPTVSGTFNYTVTVKDSAGNTGTFNCSVTVYPPVSATCVVINAIQNVAITPVTMTATGGTGTGYTFSATGLPAGLTMSTAGTISGTPTVSGTFNYTVTVKDSAGNTGTFNCSVTVYPPVSATCVVINAIQNVAITPVTMTATGGTGSGYTFSATGLPTGLTMSTAGTISGTPTVSGTFNYTVTVKDSAGNTGTFNCSVTVAPPISATCVVINAIQNVAITPVTMTATGGTGTGYIFSASGLPTGLTMSTAGTISGTPTVSGTFNYTVTVKDSAGNTGTFNCSVTVTPAISATCLVINAIQNVAITPVTMTATGGTGSGYTFSATGLPAGLTMSSGGTISGTPTVSGTFNYTVTVKDSAGNTGTFNCSVTVTPAISATCLVINAIQNVAITPVTMTATGGTGTGYTFSATGLPAGLTMSTTGTISGTPTVSGTFNYTVTVKDSAGNTGTFNCSVTVTPAISATCLVINAIQNVAITPVTMTATGGSGTGYTFSATGLPTGLAMSTAGTISGTPTVSGTFNYTVTVKDSAGDTGTFNCSVTVTPAISATCLVINAIQNVAITPVTMTATGGTGTGYTFSATGLPTGLAMSANGTISGTPTVSGTFNYTVTVKDSAGNTGTFNCSVTVTPAISATCAVINAIAGVAITPVTMTATGGTGTGYTFSASGLPTGLTMSTTGTISGTPVVGGTFNYTVTVKDSAGNTGTFNCSVTVSVVTNVCGLTWGYWKNHTWPVNSLVLGSQTYSQTELANLLSLPVAGDASINLAHQLIAAKFNVLNGTNPNTDGGAIAAADNLLSTFSGKLPYNVAPSSTAGTQMTTIAAQLDTFNSDGAGQPGCTNGPAPLTIACAASTGQVGLPYSSSFPVTGGIAPYTFSITSGSLPPGLTLNTSTGAVTGTPTTSGVFNFTVQVADATAVAGSTAGTKSLNCSITINAPPISATCAVINATQNVAITPVTMTATGGTGTGYTFSASGLPNGLTMSASGTISGTPTVSGTFSYTVTVKDSAGNTGTFNCSVTVGAQAPPPPLTLTCPAGTAQLTVSYSSSVVAGGGVPPYTFSVASGSLPPGLTLNTATGAITGTPTTSGTFGFTIQAKDSTGATALSNCSSSCSASAMWNFNVPSGTLGTSQAYTANGTTITAYGFTSSGSPVALYGKNDGGDETGLGINGLSDNEIDTTHFIQLDLTQLIASGAQNAQILINSVQAGEGYVIYGSNTLGSLGTMLNSGSLDDTPFNIPGYPNYKYISVIASGGNVLVGAVSVTVTNCNIVVSTPVDLECGTCGANKGTIGTYYSSKLAATGGTGPYTYVIVSGSLPPGLSLNTSTGVISGTPTTAGTYTFTSKATDSKGNTDTATCTIVIQPAPIDLECGSCGSGRPTAGSPYTSQLVVNGGIGPFTFSIVSGSLPPGLSLNTSTGVISGTPTTPGTYSFTSKVVDSKGSTDTAYCTIVVIASPVNLDCGSCGSGKATTGVSYSSQLSVTGGNAPYIFSLISGSLPPGLSLNTSTGVISGKPTTAGTYTFTSKVVDANGYTDTQTCTIVVQAPPVSLDCGTCGVSNAKVGSPYSATYAVTGGKAPYTFSIITGSLPPGLSLNSSTGVISGTPKTAGTYTFTAKVVDANGSYDTQQCTIIVGGTPINLDCGTCGASKATVGVSYSAQYSVTGGVGPFTYSIISGSLPAGLSLNSSTGVISGKPTTPGSYTFTARVVDSKGNSDTQACTISVTAAPIDLECGSCGSGNGTVGMAYSSQLSVTGGTGPFTYSIISGSLPAGLSLNSSTGVISGTPTTAGTYTFTSKVMDSKGTYDTTTCTIVVIVSAIDLECGSCGTGKATIGTAYSSQLAVTGGTGPFTYSIISGSLPAGLSLNGSTGVISGTPTTAGTFTFTSKVVDAKGKSDTTTCTIVVQAAPINLDCGPCSAKKALTGQAYSATMTTTGGNGHYTYSIISGSLPAGLSLNSSTGSISGTPTTPGTYTFTSKVVDSNGNSDTDICTIVVQGSPVNLACGSCGAGNAYKGQGYASTLQAIGGTGHYSYSIVSGSLPPGLSLNSATGTISGTPTTSGTYTFTSKAVDTNGNSDTSTCTINVEQNYCNWSWH